MRSTGAIIAEITEAYYVLAAQHRPWGTWVKIEHIATKTDLTTAELAEGLTEMMEYEGFQCEEQPLQTRYSEWDRTQAPVIADEARHMVRWGTGQ